MNSQFPGRYVACAVLLLLGWAWASQALAQSAERLQAYQRFEEARAAGNWSAAVPLGRKAVELAEQHAAEDGVELTDLLSGLGEALAGSGASEEALGVYKRTLDLLTARLSADDPDLVPTLQALATLHMQAKRFGEAEALLQRVLKIEQTAYGERHESALATLAKLRDLYIAAQRPEDAARTDATIDRLSTVRRDLPSNEADRGKRYVASKGFATVRVFYGTNRAPTGDPKPALHYGRDRGEVEYGYLDVTIPETHRHGELETQSRWSLFTFVMGEEARKQHFVLLQDVVPLRGQAFVTALRRQIAAAPSRDVFVFVHGFNSSFEDAARRTAQLAYDLDFDGTPMMYSWPSQASTTAYTVDEAAVGISGRKMAQFLETVVAQSGAGRIHLIAHSMGNRALLESLQTYLAKQPSSKPKKVFGQIVFTAPDVDRDYFVDAIQPLKAVAERVTLYASNNDLALKTSQTIHGAPRAGLSGANIIMVPGLDSIDMSAIKADLLGHNYYAADAGAIYDLFRLLWRGDPPPQRCGMVDRPQGSTSFWTFNVAACKGPELLEAGVLVKRFGERARARVRARIQALTDPTEKQQWSGILSRLDELLKPGTDKQQTNE